MPTRAARGPRASAAERREDVLLAAMTEFAKGGLAGTSTNVIAGRAGISQPYLFRLFPTKKALFLAAIERSFTDDRRAGSDARPNRPEGGARPSTSEPPGTRGCENHTLLGMHLQAYAACCGDDEVRATIRRQLLRLRERVVAEEGISHHDAATVVARVVLADLTAATQQLLG